LNIKTRHQTFRSLISKDNYTFVMTERVWQWNLNTQVDSRSTKRAVDSRAILWTLRVSRTSKIILGMRGEKNLFVRCSGPFISSRHDCNGTCHTSHYQHNQ